MTRNKEDVGRLAFRVEGDFWKVYYTQTNSMDDALFLGSVAMRFVEIEEAREQFMEFMKTQLVHAFDELFDATHEWTELPVPAHERKQ